MIRPDTIGELKDGAAGLVALSELFASRRVGPKSIARSLGSVVEACSAAEHAALALASDVLAATHQHPDAAPVLRALAERAVASVRALAAEAESAGRSPVDARARLVLERAAHEAVARVAATLFAGELFAAAATPRPVTVRVADVLSFGPVLPDGPNVVRASLDVPPDPATTTDARLLRALVEMCVQVVAAHGVTEPHVEVAGRRDGGALVRVGPPRTTGTTSRATIGPAGTTGTTLLTTRKLPWTEGVGALACAAAAMAGATAAVEKDGRSVTLELP